jgi:predicted N-acetyltransferase YhbS
MASKHVYKTLTLNDLSPGLLQSFIRYQETKRVWQQDNNEFQVKDDYFIDDWSEEKKESVIEELRQCITDGGVVIGSFDNDELVGFASVESMRFGSEDEYVELSYIHVSGGQRGFGIGSNLFKRCCEVARRLGAKKLYIAAHPSIESQDFYKAVGCTPAVEINRDIWDKERLDIQLEKVL